MTAYEMMRSSPLRHEKEQGPNFLGKVTPQMISLPPPSAPS